MKIEEAAARRQARIDKGEEVVVGVNKYQPKEEAEFPVLEVDNTKVRENQIARLNKMRAERDEAKCQAVLAALTQAAASGQGNLLELSIVAIRARASLGEISDALEKPFTRHRAVIRSISGVYGSVYEGDEGLAKIKVEVDAFAAEEGRRPRMLVV